MLLIIVFISSFLTQLLCCPWMSCVSCCVDVDEMVALDGRLLLWYRIVVYRFEKNVCHVFLIF